MKNIIIKIVAVPISVFVKGTHFVKGDHLTTQKSYYAKLKGGSKREMTRAEILAPFPGRKRITSNLLDRWKGKTID